jgi:hypothetical protein
MVGAYLILGAQTVPDPIPISTCSPYEEVNLVLFANILSIIFSDPGKKPESESGIEPTAVCTIRI